MNLMQKFQSHYAKKSIPKLKSGDIIKVYEQIKEGKKERIQIFEGIVVGLHRKSNLDATFKVRKISFGIGVEKTFPLHLPTITKIEILKKIKNRRAKLYYLRNLTDKQIKRRGELKKYVLWMDEKTQEKEEELKKQKEEAAKAKEETKKKEQEELDQKFAEAKGEKPEEKTVEKKSGEGNNDVQKKETGK